RVTRVGVVGLVVDVQRRRAAEDLVVALVPARDVHAHDQRLVGLVGDDDALADLGAAGPVLGRVLLRIGPAHPRGAGLGALDLLLGAVGRALAGRALAGGLAPR